MSFNVQNTNDKDKLISILFDQYSRYDACANLLNHAGFKTGQTILDVGSGYDCLFGRFLSKINITYVDPLISQSNSDQNHVTGDIYSDAFSGRTFNAVTAIDVLEHVPAQSRRDFLNRISNLAEDMIVLGFPCSDTSDATETDQALEDIYYSVYGVKYSWLKEHEKFGLPSVVETTKQLEEQSWHCQVMGHGHIPWLKELLGLVICIWDIPELSQVCLDLSEQFNRTLAPYDFAPPHYRTFILATRTPITQFIPEVPDENKLKALNTVVAELSEKVRNNTFKRTLQSLKVYENSYVDQNLIIQKTSAWGTSLEERVQQNDVTIMDLNAELQKTSAWGTSLEERVQQNDVTIMDLNAELQKTSAWGTSLHEKIAETEQACTKKHVELMKMSDWAYGMMQELRHRKMPLYQKVLNRICQLQGHLLDALARTAVGDFVRSLRAKKRYKANLQSIEELKQSLKKCKGRLIIVFPIITWDFRWQRPQQIVSRLRDKGYCVLYLAMTLTPLHKRFCSKLEASSLLGFNELAKHIHQVWLHSTNQINVYMDPLQGDDLHNITLGLEALLQVIKPSSIEYLLQFPGWWPVAERLKQTCGGKVIFDCMDDHSGFSTNTDKALETECSLIQKADLVIASSDLLECRCCETNANTIHVKNGTEFEHFNNPQKNGKLDNLADRPIIGYFGAISDWFDTDLIAYCASKRPDWNFVLIGATTGADLVSLQCLANVHLLGEKTYTELPGYFAYFDVCTIPFKLIPLTLATNPVKFYEYMSAGKPVVSVALPELLPYDEDCYIATDADGFFDQLEKALVERDDPGKVVRRISLARENSWETRVETIFKAIS